MKHQRIRKRICAWLLAIAMVVTGVNLPGNVMSVAAASNAKYEPLTVASGYNADIVATSTSSSSSEYYAKTAAMDNTGLASKGGCLYSYGANSSAGYLPADRIITSTATNGLTWKMAPYNGKNALKLTSESNYCELDFSTIGVYQKLYFLCTAGGLGTGNSGTMKAKITYTDGKIATSTFTVRDWWDNVNAATNKYKRLDSGTPDGSTSGAPYFTQCEMSVDSTRLIKNVSIAGGSSSMVVCVFGVTGLTADIAAPTISTSNVTSDGFTASWDSVPNAASYRLDVATDADFTNIVSGYNNKTVSGTSLKIQGLSSATTYYVRVRAANSAGAQSASSAYKCVKTYGKMTIIYNSNGGTGSMSNTTVAYNQSVPLSANQFTKVGYSFKNWNTQADGKGTSYVDQASVKNTDSTKNTTLTLYARWAAAGPVNLLNEGYAYGRDISTSSVTLAVDVNADDEVGSYQWQYAGEKNAAEDQWQDISDKIISEDHSNKFEIKSTNLKDGYWYRCVVNGQTKTIPVQLVKANGSTMTNVTRPYTYGQWYVSNGYVAYTSLNGKFDVLGKYEKNGTYYWLQTSYYGGWQMYTSASEAPETSSYYSNYNCSLDKLRVAFDSNDEFNMKFDALLANGQKSFAFGCDTMLGNWITSGSYSDYASLKSIKENDQIKQIQMVGAYSVDTAKATDTSFVLKYVDGFAPSYYWLGRYYNRQVWTNGTLEDVISTDSGMTSSWCNVADGNVKFEFHVGSVADAGAQITICATSEKDSITIKNPGSNCKYALYQVVNGKEELVSDWQKLSGASYTYPELEPNTKYIIKADKDGEIVTSEIYTKIDTSTGANSSVSGGKIKSGSTSSSITFTNLKNEYQYALTDSRGNVVKTYTSPNENEITFSGLKAGTTYYLIARSGENELCEKVSATTKKAVISFDANVDSGDVTGMPDSVAKVYGTAVKLPDATPVRANYQFAGWTTENYKNNQYVLYRAGSYYYGETDTTLYAVWYDASETIPTTETYTVQYDGNGNTAENVPASGTKKWGEPFTLSRMIPAAESYTFKEWNTKPDGSGTTYRPGDAYLLNKDVTLYAVWNVKQYQITVESNERYTAKVTGETVTEDGHVTYGKDAVITISANDGFDISQIKAQVNGIDITDGTLSEDKRSYTINLSDIKEDQYITVSGVNVNSIAVDESSYDFGELVEYYPSAPEAATITVTNDGEKITGAGGEEIPVTLQEQPTSDIENSAFIIGKVHDTILDSGSSATFTVQPKTGLKPGVYTENITVVTNTGARQVVKVTFEVKKDTVPPTGEISFADKKWNSLLNGITFGLFFNKTIEATISGQDEENGSGLDKIYYYIADQAMTQQDLDDMEEDQWTEGTTCSIAPNQKAVLYAKVTDRGGNVTYLSSDGVVLDDVAPEITGVEDDDELYIEKSYPIHVADANLDKVYVTEDREEATSDDEVETDDGTFTLKSEKEQSKTISAVDQAGNRSDAVTVHFVSLTALKDAAKDDIEKQAEKEKEKLGALEDLTPEEREQFEKEIDEKTAEQIEAIENAEDRKDVTQKEEKGKEELRKKLDDAVQKDLDNAKDTASKEIDKKADDAKKKIDSLTDLSDKEKEDAKKEIDQKAEDARNEISKVTDPASKGAVTVSKDAADQEIRKEQKKAEDTDLDHAKDKALDDLDQKAQDAKDAIDALEDLSEKEKEDARKEIDQKTEEAKKEIDKITDPANKNIVSENKDSADEEIRKEQEKAENTDLEHAKDKALDEIDQKAQDAKDAIDKLDDLTEQEKKDAKAEIDKKAEDAKKDIANVTDPAEKKNVSENKDIANTDIRKEQDKAAEKDLGNAKDTAVKDIEKKAEDAKQTIDAMTDLTDEEKADAKAEIDKKSEEAKKDIAKVTEPASKSAVSANRDIANTDIRKEQDKAADKDLENAKDTAVKDIDQKVEDAKKLIDSLTDLSEKEKEEAKKDIDQKAENAKNDIAKVTDPADKSEVTAKKDIADAGIQKKKEETAEKDLGYVKEKATGQIDQEAEEAQKEIDQMEDLTQEEKDAAKAEIDKKVEEAKEEITKVTDPADKSQVTAKKDIAVADIRKEQEKASEKDLENAKDTAAKEIDQKAQDAKDAINALEDLSEKEKEDARKEIDRKTEEVKKEIDKVTDPANKNIVSENKDSADEKIRKEQEKAENTDLEHAKDKASDEIDQKAQDAKDAIDKLDDLTEQEKKDAKAEIDKKAEDAKKDIANVTDPAEKKNVSENKDSADQEIRKEQEKAAGKDLGNAKDTAVKEIDKKLEDALNAVDRLTNLSAAEKEKAKEEIKKQAEDAKNNIQDATEKSDVKNTKTEISADIVEKVDDAKKNDYDQTKDETANGVLTVVADSEKETAADKKYKVSLRLGNTEVEFKDSVAAGEKVSFDQIPDGIYNLVVSDGENQRTTYVKVTNGTATEVGKVSLSSQSTSVDVKLGAPDIAVAGLEKVYDTDVFKENEEAVKVIREGTGKVDVKLTADNVDQKDEMIENVVPEGKEINRYAELLADMIVTDAEGKTKNYNLRDIQQLVLIAMPLSEQEKNHTGYVLYRKHNDGTGEKVETLPMLSGEEQTAPTGEGFYMDRDYVYIWAQKFSVYALAYDAGSVAPTATPEVPTPTPVESTVTPVEPTETPEAPTPAETPSVTKAPSKIKDQSKLSGNEIDKLKLPLLLAQGKGGNKKISLSWTKLKKATGYECYWSYCDGKKFFRKFKATKDGKAAAVHKKLKNNRKYKYFVVAYQMVDGNKIYIAKSPQLHIAMKADKQTNVSKLMVNVTKVTLNKGKTFRTECRSTLENVKKKQVLHAKEYRYYTSDKKIAVVDKDGQIKATGNGNCTVTIIANNGVYRKISVTVSKTAKATRAKALVTDGAKFTDKATKAVYVITSLKNKTVALAGTEDVQLKDLETAVTVKYEGTVYRVTAIADNAFAGNKMLESVTLHKDIQSVGKAAFKNCKNLKKVTAYSVKWNKESLGTNAFQGISSKVHVYCMESVWEKYEALVEKANIPKGKMINLIDK